MTFKISVPKKGLRVAWVAALHIPYHDPKAIGCARGVLESYKPDVVIFGGDLIDANGISKFQKNPTDPISNDFQRELDRFQDIFAGLVRSAGKAKRYALPGNHEARMGKLLKERAPALFGLDALQIPKLLELEKFDVAYLPRLSIGGVIFEHGNIIRKYSGGSVMAMMEAASYGYPIVMGHSHRLGLVFKSRPGLAPIWGVESGHLCEPGKLDYLASGFANWQVGMSIVSFVDGVVIPQPLPFHKSGGAWSSHF